MFRGLTWDHPRGYDALAEAARQVNATQDKPLIHWDRQPLEGFESAPIAELAAGYDLLVLDHPHIGEAVASACLQPLDDFYSAERIDRWQRQSVGPSMASYQWAGKSWALPLDVATQVMARRADRIPEPPTSWDEVLQLAKSLPVALSLAGPHAFLTLLSMVAGQGGTVGGEVLFEEDPAGRCLTLLQELYVLRPKGSEVLNPIALSETMADSDAIALMPLIFGYVTYAKAGPGQIAFSDTLGVGGPRSGGVLGGTGIGFCKGCEPSEALLEHIAWLMDVRTQCELIPDHGGQPSAREAWMNPGVNAAWGGFYQSCLKTAEAAHLRPRFDGFVAFQTEAARTVREALESRQAETATLKNLQAQWQRARAKARDQLKENDHL